MSKITFPIPALIAVLVVGGLTACGGGAPSKAAAQTPNTAVTHLPSAALIHLPVDVVAQVGKVPITKATLNRWMSAMAGGDFYETARVPAPKGIASDPPNYAVCVASLKALRAKRIAEGAKPTAGDLQNTCRELIPVIKQQALSYLIQSQLSIYQDAELGLKVTDAEVGQEFKKLRAERFPKETELQTYLASRGWTLAVELYLIKRDMLSTKLLQKFSKPGDEHRLGTYLNEAAKKLTARTTCRTGYVVEGCKQYQAPTTHSTPSPAILIEGLTGAK